MLTIDRKEGQAIFFDDLKMKVLETKMHEVVVKIEDRKHRIKSGQHITFNRMNIYLLKTYFSEDIHGDEVIKARFGCEGRKGVKILRDELYNKDKEERYHNIDNATKQFPSGDF